MSIELHGGHYAGGKYRKGSEISAFNLGTSAITVVPMKGMELITHTSYAQSIEIDEINNYVLSSSDYGSSGYLIKGAPLSTGIRTFSFNKVNTYGLTSVGIYIPEANKLYVNEASTDDVEIFSNTGTAIATIRDTRISQIITQTKDYVIYYDAAFGKVRKITFATDTVTDVFTPTGLGTASSMRFIPIDNWDKHIICGSSQFYFVNHDGSAASGLLNYSSLPSNRMFYHAASNKLISINSWSNDQVLRKYNPSTLAEVEAVTFNASGSFRIVGYDGKQGIAVLSERLAGYYLIKMLPNGSFDLPGTNPFGSSFAPPLKPDGTSYYLFTKAKEEAYSQRGVQKGKFAAIIGHEPLDTTVEDWMETALYQTKIILP